MRQNKSERSESAEQMQNGTHGRDRKEVQQLIDLGKSKGFLTYEEVNDALPADVVALSLAPDMDKLAEFVEQVTSQLEKAKADAEGQRKKAEEDARAACKKAGLDYEKVLRDAEAEAGALAVRALLARGKAPVPRLFFGCRVWMPAGSYP